MEMGSPCVTVLANLTIHNLLLPHCCVTATPSLPRCYPTATLLLSHCYPTATPLLSHCYPTATPPLPRCYPTASPLLPHRSPLLSHCYPTATPLLLIRLQPYVHNMTSQSGSTRCEDRVSPVQRLLQCSWCCQQTCQLLRCRHEIHSALECALPVVVH